MLIKENKHKSVNRVADLKQKGKSIGKGLPGADPQLHLELQFSKSLNSFHHVFSEKQEKPPQDAFSVHSAEQ